MRRGASVACDMPYIQYRRDVHQSPRRLFLLALPMGNAAYAYDSSSTAMVTQILEPIPSLAASAVRFNPTKASRESGSMVTMVAIMERPLVLDVPLPTE